MNLEEETLPYKSYHQQLVEANANIKTLRELISTLGDLLVKEQEARIRYRGAIWDMINHGGLLHGPEGMTKAQQSIYNACEDLPEFIALIQEQQRNYEEAKNRNVRLEPTPETYAPNPKPVPAWRRLLSWL